MATAALSLPTLEGVQGLLAEAERSVLRERKACADLVARERLRAEVAEHKCAKLTEALGASSAALDALRAEHEALKRDASAAVKTAAAEHATLQGRLAGEAQARHRAVAEAQALADRLSDSVRQRTAEIAARQRELMTRETTVAEREALLDAQQELADWQTDIANREAKLAKEQAVLIAREATLHALPVRLAISVGGDGKTDRAAAVSLRVEALRAELATMQAEQAATLRMLEDHVESKMALEQSAARELAAKKASLNEATALIAELTAALNVLRKQHGIPTSDTGVMRFQA